MSLNEKKKKKRLDDVNEGKTLFVRNLSFDTEVENLKAMMEQFGEIEYCLLCEDKDSGQSKGTAFVKFTNKEMTDACLEKANGEDAEREFYMDGRQLNVTLAINREQLQKKANEDKFAKPKDKRNIYLAKEGLIYPDSDAAVGVSQQDLTKRLALEVKKRKLLQNYQKFVSPTRLCVHNIPSSFTEQRLKVLFLRAVEDKSAKITEIRIMKNRQADKTFAGSKGFGFIEFTEHKHALKALRAINNNPMMFQPDKRPIVEFSIEDMMALNKKKWREDKSRRMNKNATNTIETKKEEANTTETKKEEANTTETKKETKVKKSVRVDDSELEDEDEADPYCGLKTRHPKEGEEIKLPKINRKVYEARKKLKEKKREFRSEARLKKAEMERQIRKNEKRKMREGLTTTKRRHKEEEKFETEHLKKKSQNIRQDDESMHDTESFIPFVKRRKWYN